MVDQITTTTPPRESGADRIWNEKPIPQVDLSEAVVHVWARKANYWSGLASDLYAELKQVETRLSESEAARVITEAKLNAPEIHDFVEGVKLEAAHQRERWGTDHDTGKTAEDWMWVVAYLTTKATQAKKYGDQEKYLHHIVTAAAVLCNWHANATEANTRMKPGAPDSAEALATRPTPTNPTCPQPETGGE